MRMLGIVNKNGGKESIEIEHHTDMTYKKTVSSTMWSHDITDGIGDGTPLTQGFHAAIKFGSYSSMLF